MRDELRGKKCGKLKETKRKGGWKGVLRNKICLEIRRKFTDKSRVMN